MPGPLFSLPLSVSFTLPRVRLAFEMISPVLVLVMGLTLARCIFGTAAWSTNIVIIAFTIILSGNVHLSFFLSFSLFVLFFHSGLGPVLPLKAIGVKFVNAPGFLFLCLCLSSLSATIFVDFSIPCLIYVRISLRLVAYPFDISDLAAGGASSSIKNDCQKDVSCDL